MLYAAVLDGPADCKAWQRGGDSSRDMMVFFTGSAWNERSANCRAQSLWFGAYDSTVVEPVSTELDLHGNGQRLPAGRGHGADGKYASAVFAGQGHTGWADHGGDRKGQVFLQGQQLQPGVFQGEPV